MVEIKQIKRHSKRFVDVEHALRWAYRDELPKRQPGGRIHMGEMPSTSPMFREAVSSESGIDQRRDPGFPAALGDAHPDALAIEAAVDELKRYAATTFDDDAGVMFGLEYWATDLGGPIDWRQAVAEATGAMVGTVATHARIGGRPSCSRMLPVPRRVIGANGKPKVLIDEEFVEVIDKDGKSSYAPAKECAPSLKLAYVDTVSSPAICTGRYKEGSYCPLAYAPDPAKIVTGRAEYATWRAALEILAVDLEGQLMAFAVLPPAAPLRPWMNDSGVHGRPGEPFAALRAPVHRIETREQAAVRRRHGARRQLAVRDADATPRRQVGPVTKRGDRPA